MKDNLKIILTVVVMALALLAMTLKITLDNKKEEDVEETVKKILIIEGLEEEVEYRKVTSSKGYIFLYDPTYLNNKKTDDGYLLESKTDKNIYIKIEETKKETYDTLESEVKDGMLLRYYYRTNNKEYYKITTSYPNDPEYIEGIGTRLYDMVSSFEFKK